MSSFANPSKSNTSGLEEVKEVTEQMKTRRQEFDSFLKSDMQEAWQMMTEISQMVTKILQMVTEILQMWEKGKFNKQLASTFIDRVKTLDESVFQPISKQCQNLLKEERRPVIRSTSHLDEALRACNLGLNRNKSSRTLLRRPAEPFGDQQLKAVNDIITSCQAKGHVMATAIMSRWSDHKIVEFDLRNEGGDSTRQDYLVPHVREILDSCPKFRLLLLGRSRAEKSNLIKRIFNVDTMEQSPNQAMRAAIVTEFTSEQNPYVIWYDSNGSEYERQGGCTGVKNFIQSRSQAKDRLHAIWLCVDAVARPSLPRHVNKELLDVAASNSPSRPTDKEILDGDTTECLLQLADKDILGDVPLIVVFTNRDMQNSGAKGNEGPLLQREDPDYMQPFQDAVKDAAKKSRANPPPCISDLGGYDNLVIDLIRTTAKLPLAQADAKMEILVGTTPHNITWAITQRADAEMSRDASIVIGKLKYWKGIATGKYFKDKYLINCLWVLHMDSVTAWNLFDPDEWLIRPFMMEQLSNIISDLYGSKDSGALSIDSGSKDSGVSPIVSSSTMTAATLVVPAAAPWIYDVYEQSPTVTGCLIAYTLDLNLILWQLYWVMRERGDVQPMTQEIIQDVIDSFKASHRSRWIHQAIQTLVQDNVESNGDAILDKMIRLLQQYSQ
ncbi:hypothetical protein NEOLEDRAFT_1242793 [Neolentinus lepideus HHB14362 ss-1]|uniref:G domain-containing protein n=1 Tax=Neolentinus lepideus HHB14362 ss-1 TaxID=1314782 RepID=A0A165RP53_9AGAM|nr:hypothetical protein NEOLEDRAFT_1242793 [Neolentinus lepideus HHB14362 ss-1]